MRSAATRSDAGTSRSFILGLVVNPIRGFSVELQLVQHQGEGRDPGRRSPRTLTLRLLKRSAGLRRRLAVRPTGHLTSIRGFLQNIASIRTNGIDLNLAYRTRLANWGDLGLTWNNTFLNKFDVLTPTATGTR